jgi:hypothetical protein
MRGRDSQIESAAGAFVVVWGDLQPLLGYMADADIAAPSAELASRR